MADELFWNFFKGLVRLRILHRAAGEPTCGADIIQELSGYGYNVSPGTLYPILHQLEAGGYLQSQSAIVNGKRRKNYRLTKTGRKVLTKARSKLRELTSELL